MNLPARELPVSTDDGHRFTVQAVLPSNPQAAVLWLPALGVAARHYLPWAEALAATGHAVFLHEWRGNGSSSLRPTRDSDWGYRELLAHDLPATLALMRQYVDTSVHVIGGHSLGGQLACCFAGLHPRQFQRLWLVASGTPYWRSFPGWRGHMLPLFYQFAIWLARTRGTFPGRQLGFGGVEARGLITDWARVGLGGRYAAAGLDAEPEAGMAALEVPVATVLLADDWLAPDGSLQALLEKLPASPARQHTLEARELGVTADHFAWMKQPDAVIRALLG